MKFSKKEILIICGISLLLSFVIVLIWYGETRAPTLAAVNNFEECTNAGYPIMESYPRQCRTPDGRNFVEIIEQPTDKSDLIVVDSPKPNETVTSPLVVKGKARGNWFFEASFPVELLSIAQGTDGAPDSTLVIAQTVAQAKSDWMTTDFVPFEATITFSSPSSDRAILVLKKDNPSGLPEHNDSLSIPVKVIFKASGECRSTGCSGQICSNREVITTCEYKAEYACYKTAKCERQSSGTCGWTATQELQACIKNPPPLN